MSQRALDEMGFNVVNIFLLRRRNFFERLSANSAKLRAVRQAASMKHSLAMLTGGGFEFRANGMLAKLADFPGDLHAFLRRLI